MYRKYHPGDKIQLIENYYGYPQGTLGTVISRFVSHSEGLIYLIELDEHSIKLYCFGRRFKLVDNRIVKKNYKIV